MTKVKASVRMCFLLLSGTVTNARAGIRPTERHCCVSTGDSCPFIHRIARRDMRSHSYRTGPLLTIRVDPRCHPLTKPRLKEGTGGKLHIARIHLTSRSASLNLEIAVASQAKPNSSRLPTPPPLPPASTCPSRCVGAL